MNRPCNAWMNLHATAMLIAVGAVIATRMPAVAVVVIGVSVTVFILRCSPADASMWRIAQAGNWLTGCRLAVVLAAVLLMHKLSPAAIFLLFAANVTLDALDGFVARKLGQATAFGALFDQEVDAVFVLCTGLYFWSQNDIGLWILLPGLLRYLFRVTVWVVGPEQFVEKRRPMIASVAGINFVLLTVAVILPAGLQLAALAVSTSLFVFSFTLSFLELQRTLK